MVQRQGFMSRFYIQILGVTNQRRLTRVWSGSVSHSGLRELVRGRRGYVCVTVVAGVAAAVR